MSRQKVAVAMSGGVDSSMAAALLKEAGREVTGFHMLLRSGNTSTPDLDQTCRILDIPLYKLDLAAQFQDAVVSYVCQEYGRGRTPNPCIACNRYIKFGLLFEKARQMGADYLATGHHARIKLTPDGYQLLKAVDRSRDQSYFLYTLGQNDLKYLLFPIGDYLKKDIKQQAARLGLPAASRRESRDMCFIPGTDYRAFVTQRIIAKPGDIVDTIGKVLGSHQGLANYTIGQRHGLGFATGKPLYVLKLDVTSNRVVVGTSEQLMGDTLVVTNLKWTSGEAPKDLSNITAKIRYRSPAESAISLQLNNGAGLVRFQQPQRAITPGQSIVFYHGEIVLGGGIIEGADAVLV